MLALVKPQFEAERSQVGHGGVVRDPAVHRHVLLARPSLAQRLDTVQRKLVRRFCAARPATWSSLRCLKADQCLRI